MRVINIFLYAFFICQLAILILLYPQPQVAAPSSKASSSTSKETVTYYLALTWPVSFCNNKEKVCNDNIPDHFTIHGLWAYTKPFEEVDPGSNHQPPPYKEAKLKHIEKELQQKWPNLQKGGTHWLWNHEWETHGHLYGLGLEGYFRLALELYDKFDVLEIFLTADDRKIMPHAKKLHYPWDFTDRIRTVTKSRPRIQCNRYDDGKIGKGYQLSEVIICFDEHKIPTDCPKHPSGTISPGCSYEKLNRFPSINTLWS